MDPLQAIHMSITAADLKGNGSVGRYLLLPGSDGRARLMADRLKDLRVVHHSRQHNFYAGHINVGGEKIDIGIISTGMGCPSIDIIATELLSLGAKRLIRVGTAGSLQHDRIKVGALVVPTAAVRDEGTTRHYLDPTIPVQPSMEFLDVVREAAVRLNPRPEVYLGSVHTKDSLYAREFGQGPFKQKNEVYMAHLTSAGVLASEMECAQLFALVQIRNQENTIYLPGRCPIWCGAILAIIGDHEPFAEGPKVAATTQQAIDLGFAVIENWYSGVDRAWR